jgi:hypothetical protein
VDLTQSSDGRDIGVRCCSDTQISGFELWGDADICPFADTTLGEEQSCNQGLNFELAEDLCQVFGARLCTKTELENECTKGSGCSHNFRYNWSSSTSEDA